MGCRRRKNSISYPLIEDWKGNLPNIRNTFAQEEIDWILMEAAKSRFFDVRVLIDFIIKNGHKEVVELLLRNGADLNLTNNERSTPLHIICKRYAGSINILVRLFFKIIDDMQQTVQLDVRDELGRTPLQWAVTKLSPVTVNLLMVRGADLSNFVFHTVSYFDNRFDRTKYYSYRYKVGRFDYGRNSRDRWIEMNRSDALTIMTLFAQYEMFKKSAT
uniref:Uncharacterized protein n=1 Tax=Trichogramma kaykai TaxID=54128 RepID=A0ABD2XDY1_9HYME